MGWNGADAGRHMAERAVGTVGSRHYLWRTGVTLSWWVDGLVVSNVGNG